MGNSIQNEQMENTQRANKLLKFDHPTVLQVEQTEDPKKSRPAMEDAKDEKSIKNSWLSPICEETLLLSALE